MICQHRCCGMCSNMMASNYHSYIEAQTNMFKCILLNEEYYILVIISLTFVPKGSTDESTLFQVMAWCLTAPNHYLKQCWQWSLMAYYFTRPQWVKSQQPVDSIRYEFDEINFDVEFNINMTSSNLTFGIFNLQKRWSCGPFYKQFLTGDKRNMFCCIITSESLITAHICKYHYHTAVIM